MVWLGWVNSIGHKRKSKQVQVRNKYCAFRQYFLFRFPFNKEIQRNIVLHELLLISQKCETKIHLQVQRTFQIYYASDYATLVPIWYELDSILGLSQNSSTAIRKVCDNTKVWWRLFALYVEVRLKKKFTTRRLLCYVYLKQKLRCECYHTKIV